MNDGLIYELKKTSESFSTVAMLNEREAKELILDISNRYVTDINKIWWWESLSTECERIEYGDSDGLKIIREKFTEDPVVLLFVSDDNPQPWPVFRGVLSEILELIGEVHFFEYILADQNLNWLIFDTHHNTLVITGAAKAQT